MKIFLKIVLFPLELVCYVLIYFYKFIISPLMPNTCIYYPSCSTYMLQAVKEFGVIKGVFLGLKRIFRCNPKHVGGLDLVPLNIKGEKLLIK